MKTSTYQALRTVVYITGIILLVSCLALTGCTTINQVGPVRLEVEGRYVKPFALGGTWYMGYATPIAEGTANVADR